MTIRNHSLYAGIAAFVFLFSLTPAPASVISIYSDRSQWEGATDSQGLIDFSTLGLGPGQYTMKNTAAGLTIDGVQFVGHGNPGYQLRVANPVVGAVDYFGSGAMLFGPDYYASTYLSVLLPANTTSFGLDLMTSNPSAQSFQILLDDVNLGTVIMTQAAPTRTFFGVTTDTAVSEVKIKVVSGTISATYPIYDNVGWGTVHVEQVVEDPPPLPPPDQPEEVPEATTFLYAATGILLFSAARKLRSC